MAYSPTPLSALIMLPLITVRRLYGPMSFLGVRSPGSGRVQGEPPPPLFPRFFPSAHFRTKAAHLNGVSFDMSMSSFPFKQRGASTGHADSPPLRGRPPPPPSHSLFNSLSTRSATRTKKEPTRETPIKVQPGGRLLVKSWGSPATALTQNPFLYEDSFFPPFFFPITLKRRFVRENGNELAHHVPTPSPDVFQR